MKTNHLLIICAVIFLSTFTGCLYEASVEPSSLDLVDVKSTDIPLESGLEINKNSLILYVEYEKGKEKIEVNRNQATLNFDNYDPRVVSIQTNGKFVNLKNFRAQNNLLKTIPDFALQQGIKRINVSNNRITRLPVFKKNTSLLYLDLSYNKLKANIDELRKMALPAGATLDLTKTGISCKYIHDYMKRYPQVEVIHDCEKVIKEPIKELVK